MNNILVFIPLLVSLVVYAAFLKLSARLLRITGVSWPYSFAISAIFGVIAIVGAAIPAYFVGLVIALPLGVVLHFAILSWLLKDRGIDREGRKIGWVGGMKLAALTMGLYLALALVLALASQIIFLALPPVGI